MASEHIDIDVDNNKYTTQWVYATNDPAEPIYVVIGQNNISFDIKKINATCSKSVNYRELSERQRGKTEDKKWKKKFADFTVQHSAPAKLLRQQKLA